MSRVILFLYTQFSVENFVHRVLIKYSICRAKKHRKFGNLRFSRKSAKLRKKQFLVAHKNVNV